MYGSAKGDHPSKIDDWVKQRLVWEPDGATVLISRKLHFGLIRP